MADARAEMDVLLNAGLRSARGMLLEQREFTPFALVMALDGQVRQLRAKSDSKDQPIDHLIQLTQQFLRELAGKKEAKATAVLSDIRIRVPGGHEEGDGTPAIRVQLEHSAATPITCFLPYSLKDERITPGTMLAEHGDAIVFAAPAAVGPSAPAATPAGNSTVTAAAGAGGRKSPG